MKVLVTGSEGSLMQMVIPLLVKKGHDVYGIDNLSRYGERFDDHNKNYEFIKCDLTNRTHVEEIFAKVKPNFVIQAAATIYGVGGFNKHCSEMYKDISLHDNVLHASTKNKVEKVIYISSSMVYENCPQDINSPVIEDMIENYPAPYTDYGLSKFVGERVSKAYFKQHGLKYTIWRPFNIITPYEKSESNDIGISHVFADYIKNIVIDRCNPLPIIGDGQQIRCFTWIGNIANAIVDFSFDDKTNNQIYNLGNPEPITMKDLAEKIKNIAVKEYNLFEDYIMKYDTISNYANDVRVRIPDCNKARIELNWTADIKVDTSIRLCLNHILKK